MGPMAPSRQPDAPSAPPPESAVAAASRPDHRHRWLGVLLFLAVFAVFLPTLRHGFTTYDDPAYVSEEPHVNSGLSWANFRWAWTSLEHSNWHPLTWLSHQLDCTLFGLAPWGHHLTNILLHAGSVLLLFLVLRRATGFLWRSLLVAALFGLHPLRVESVAWIAERKDVLSTFLGLLALRPYVAYAQRVRDGRPRAWLPYALSLLAFAASLTAKPMLVTLPCVLLLLDLWPLGRWSDPTAGTRLRLVVEKLPFAALSAASCVLTMKAQSAGGAMQAVENFPLTVRAANAVVAYAQYVGKFLWPADLAVLYPNFGEMPPLAHVMVALAVLLLLTAAAEACRRSRPWALVGWLWFLGTLVPVIGLVQVGGQTMADRYSYVPSIGLALVLVWAVADATAALRRRTPLLASTAIAAVAACAGLTLHQLTFWKDSETLFRHTIAVTEDNWMAHFNLFLHYQRTPATQSQAKAEYEATVAIVSKFAELQNQRGLALLDRPGRLPEAIAYFQKALRVKKDNAAAHLNLGRALLRLGGHRAEALAEFKAALHFKPDYPEAVVALGAALAEDPATLGQGTYLLRTTIWRLPETAELHCTFAAALARDPNHHEEAVQEYEKALQLDPQHAAARAGLAALHGATK